jgi:hypothetical protein
MRDTRPRSMSTNNLQMGNFCDKSDRQVQSPHPGVSSAKARETSGVLQVLSGFAQGRHLQGLSSVRKQVVHISYTRIVAGACALAFWLLAQADAAKAHVPGCHSRACDQRIHEKRRAHWKRTHIWEYRFHHLTTWERRWTRCISFHESGNRAVARESGHYGYFQWAMATWHAAGGAGNPELHSWHEQAVRAVHWAHRAGSSQWTTSATCGSV